MAGDGRRRELSSTGKGLSPFHLEHLVSRFLNIPFSLTVNLKPRPPDYRLCLGDRPLPDKISKETVQPFIVILLVVVVIVEQNEVDSRVPTEKAFQ